MSKSPTSSTWSSWCDIDFSSAAHHPDIKQKAAYDTAPGKSIGGGCHMPAITTLEGMDDRLYLIDPANKNPPPRRDIEIDRDGITNNIMRDERLAIVRQWVRTKENELTIRKDARFARTIFIPIPNELSARDAVRFGDMLCRSLFADHQYSFSVHAKETILKKHVPGGRVAEFARKNNHVHIMFSERSLTTGKKGTGDARPFKGRVQLHRLVVTKSDEILAKKFGITIRKPNAGDEKKVRVPRAQYYAQLEEDKLLLAAIEAEEVRVKAEAEVEQREHDFEHELHELTVLERGTRQDSSVDKTTAANVAQLERDALEDKTDPADVKKAPRTHTHDDGDLPGMGMDR